MIDSEELLQALDRIARTSDGQLLYLYFQRVMLELPLEPHPSDSALRDLNGRRSLAGELMGRMAKGMSESGSGTPAERPVVFAPRGAASLGARGSARQRLIASDPELESYRSGDA